MNVLIPTSGLGSRLGDLTNYLNKSLVPVGGKAVISHIIESYPEDTAFFIMLGHKGELVQEYVSLAHPTLNVTYLDLEMHEGNLGFIEALRRQREVATMPFIFHAADTIVTMPDRFLSYDGNAVIGSIPSGDVSQYRSIRPKGDGVVIRDKGEQIELHPMSDLVHVGVVKFADVEALNIALDHAPSEGSDVDLINAMPGKFARLITDRWYDTGNISRLQEAQAEFGQPVVLDKGNQAIYFIGRDRVIKFFEDAQTVTYRVQRAKTLGDVVPTVTGSTAHFMQYKWFYGDLARDTMRPARFIAFLDWCKTNLWTEAPEELPRAEEALEFYFEKTSRRLREFYAKTGIEDRHDNINGENIPPVSDMLSQIDWAQLIPKMVAVKKFHGDLHFSNILDSGKDWKLLDWRETFGSTTAYGDVYYDLAKLLHGLIVSHDLVDAAKFDVTIWEENGHRHVTFDILRHSRHVECEEFFHKWCLVNGYDWELVRFICALIFLNIAALHHHSYDHFLYFLGKRMLFDCMA